MLLAESLTLLTLMMTMPLQDTLKAKGPWFVSNRLKKQIEVEKEMLNQLLSDHMPLLKKCIDQTSDRIELSALAAMLH